MLDDLQAAFQIRLDPAQASDAREHSQASSPKANDLLEAAAVIRDDSSP
ncbi:MAG: hypothetical protein ACSLFB_09710 [Acidimicrobiales bacterium]